MILPLTDPRATDPARAGGKAARLALALQAGHPVPMGFVLPADALNEADPAALDAALASLLGELDGPVAVRSSGLAEDLDDGSFAGQYETVLDVRGLDAARAAVARCLASARAPRVLAYRAARGLPGAPMAVLVQRFLPACAAGVAFTAHPITGERGVVVLSAVRGVGEAVVSGLADAEEWELRPGQTLRRRSPSPVLREADAEAIAALARAVAGDAPTDIEWALYDGQLWLLQARPMTALPDPVRWDAPLPGGWVRNFRLGEWLGAPVTPLFESWYLQEVEEAQARTFEALYCLTMQRPLHVTVNGWYFLGLAQPTMRWAKLPTLLWNLLTRFRRMASTVPPLAHLGFDSEVARWRTELLPAWRAVVDEAAARVDEVPVADLPALVQAILEESGQQIASILGVAGYAAKAEAKLFELLRTLPPTAEVTAHELVSGGAHEPAAHDVEGLDWVFPTLGERQVAFPAPPSAEQRAALAARRAAAEERVRAALPAGRRAHFDAVVAEARRAHAVRMEQTGLFTLGHPVLRRALARLGEALVASGQLVRADDIYFLTRTELSAAREGASARPPVAQRRDAWMRQRRLTPPLVVGELQGMFRDVFAQIDALTHHPEHDAADALRGMPGAPGRVTGPARVIHHADELDRLQPGEILVAPVTTPLWTLAFGRASAIVTDTGSVASHASIVAREYGIPAVVGTGSGTARIVDGQRITVDGGRGVVRLDGAGGP